LPNESNTREESKRSNEPSLSVANGVYNQGDMKSTQGLRLNLTQESLETDQTQLINALKIKNKEQDKLLDEYKEREVSYKDKIYQVEKELREAKHLLELSKMEHEREVQLLNSKLEKKTDE
jgi:hypothetical protein